MKGTTHLAAGVTAALLLADKGVIPAAAIIAGSVLPDIDSPKSLVGRHFPVVPKLLPHRTVTHSLIFCVAAYFINPYLALGILIHILLDLLNPKGVKFLWPLKAKVRIPVVNKWLPQDGVFDNILGAFLYFYNVYLLVCMLLHIPATNLLFEMKDRIGVAMASAKETVKAKIGT